MLRGAPLRVDCPWVGRCHGRGGEVSMIRKAGPISQADHARVKGRIAQVVEQLTLNQRVQGSSPCAPTVAYVFADGRGTAKIAPQLAGFSG